MSLDHPKPSQAPLPLLHRPATPTVSPATSRQNPRVSAAPALFRVDDKRWPSILTRSDGRARSVPIWPPRVADRWAPLAGRLNRPSPACRGWIGPACVGSAQSGADLARGEFFLGKSYYPFSDLQTLKIHRKITINFLQVIQVPVSSLTCYLSDDIGPMSVGSL
jgi:hypothetical protein